MNKGMRWFSTTVLALAVGVTTAQLPATAAPGDAAPPSIVISEVPVSGISGYHGGQQAEMDALAAGVPPKHDPSQPFDGLTLVPRKAQAEAFEIPSDDYLRFSFLPDFRRPGSVIHVELPGAFTAVDVKAPAGTSPSALADAVRAKYHIKDGESLLGTLGSQHKFVRVEQAFAPDEWLDTKPQPAVTMYLPWTLSAWSNYQRTPAHSVASDLEMRNPGEPMPPYMAGLIDEVADKCAGGVTYALCKIPAQDWANIIARTDQVVDAASADGAFRASPKATATKALDAKGVDKVTKAASTAVTKASKSKLPANLQPKAANVTKALKAVKPWALSLSVTAIRMTDTFNNPSATVLDKVESVVAAVPLVGETVGFANAMSKGDVEGVFINVISLATLGAAHACPPLALVGGAILATHALVKGLISLFAAEPVAKEPPDVQYEQARDGAEVAWATDIPKNLAYRTHKKKPNPQLSNTVTVDAKKGYVFSFSRVSFAYQPQLPYRAAELKQARVWQDGHLLYTMQCATKALGGWLGLGLTSSSCNASAPTVVTHGHGLRVQLLYQGFLTTKRKRKYTVDNGWMYFPGDRRDHGVHLPSYTIAIN